MKARSHSSAYCRIGEEPMKAYTSSGTPVACCTSDAGTMSATTVRQATLARIFKCASRISSTSRCTAARWWGPAPGSPTSSCATPSRSSRWRISIFSSMRGSMALGLWIPSRSVSSRATASKRRPHPRSSATFQSKKRSCSTGMREILRRLEEERDALPAADAGGTDAPLRLAARKLVEEMGGDARARRRERMSDGDGPSVDVGILAGEPQILLHRQVLRSERLVHLEQVEVLEARLVPLESPADGWRGTDSHDRRIAARGAPAEELADGLETALLGELPGGNDQRSGAVADAARRSGVDDAVLLEDFRKLGEALDGGVGAVVLVAAEVDGLALLPSELHGGELFGEPARLLRGGESPLREHGVLVHLALRDAVLGSEVLGGHRHGEAVVAVGEAVPERVLELRRLAEPDAEPQPASDVRRLRHVLGTADEGALRMAGENLERRVDDGLETRTAEAVHGERGHVLG